MLLGSNGSGVMAADVVEGTQLAVTAANDEQRLAGKFGGDELPGACDLIGARDHLPGAAEDAFALKLRDALVGVPDGRNG